MRERRRLTRDIGKIIRCLMVYPIEENLGGSE